LSISKKITGTDDSRPAAVKTDIIDNVVRGVENLASFSRVEGAGHLVNCTISLFCWWKLTPLNLQVVQVNPRGLAQKIYDALNTPLGGIGAKL
jgi:hypothetical protein